MSSKRKRKSNKRNKRKLKKWVLKLLIILLLFIVGIGAYFFLSNNKVSLPIIKEKYEYLASDVNEVLIYDLDEEKKELTLNDKRIVRGKKVKVLNKDFDKDDVKYKLVELDGKSYYINSDNIVSNEKDVVLEKKIYIRTAHTILEDIDSSKINGFAPKGSEMEVVDYDYLNDDGSVHLYKVKDGYVYGKYTSYTLEDAKKNYKSDVYDAIHSKVSNSYGGGDAIKLDFYPY